MNMTNLKSSPAAIAERIYALADAAGVQRRGLAKWLADQCGISYKATHKWLRGETAPSLNHVEVVAYALASSPSYLLFGETPNSEEHPQIPIQLRSIALMQTNGDLFVDDLHEIERFAKVLERKNKLSSLPRGGGCPEASNE
jgi:transcriptional regulator with XRE-family HTH domain